MGVENEKISKKRAANRKFHLRGSDKAKQGRQFQELLEATIVELYCNDYHLRSLRPVRNTAEKVYIRFFKKNIQSNASDIQSFSCNLRNR